VKTRSVWLVVAAISRVASADLADDVQKARGLRFRHPVAIVTQPSAAGSASVDVWGVARGGADVDAYYDGSAVIARPDAPELAIAGALDRALIEQRFPRTGSGDAARAYDLLETADAEVLAVDLAVSRAGKPSPWSDAEVVAELIGSADDPALAHIVQLRSKSWRAVDRLWAQPPTSTTAVLRPGSRIKPIELAAEAPADWTAIDSSTFGELGARELLAAHGASRTEAREATAGWLGDRAIACTRGTRTLAIWRSEWSSEADAERAREAIDRAIGDLVAGLPTGAGHWLALDGSTALVERRDTSVIAAIGLPLDRDVDPWSLVAPIRRTNSSRAR
jgi:hypothetical protein